ncbi:hypothetical protein [Bizionia myxarmorum]|uniref:Uncharacterized protein n=1 Tax=Bizionia myxarmorum TaxID=291186 RepID=A0A5D0R720_9FLAO|nr:hypothetical protein [Bizionia myxarmorum]TYB76354.1 hypothetical protein ES674_12250 [Bizionia myxarmorum]
MIRTLYRSFIVLSAMLLFNCKEKNESTSNLEINETAKKEKVIDTVFNHIYTEIDDKKYDFSYNVDTLDVFLTTNYGKTKIFFEFTKEITFVPDSKHDRLNGFYDKNYKLDIRNITFNDSLITYKEYKDDIFHQDNEILVSENITKTDFYESLDSNFLLDGKSIHDKLIEKPCASCVVVLTILATNVVGDSRGSNKELCEQQNALVAVNCANKDDFCLESEGPCKLKCVPCSTL